MTFIHKNQISINHTLSFLTTFHNVPKHFIPVEEESCVSLPANLILLI